MLQLKITLKKEGGDSKTLYNEYFYAGGLVEYVKWLNTDKVCTLYVVNLKFLLLLFVLFALLSPCEVKSSVLLFFVNHSPCHPCIPLIPPSTPPPKTKPTPIQNQTRVRFIISVIIQICYAKMVRLLKRFGTLCYLRFHAFSVMLNIHSR